MELSFSFGAKIISTSHIPAFMKLKTNCDSTRLTLGNSVLLVVSTQQVFCQTTPDIFCPNFQKINRCHCLLEPPIVIQLFPNE